MKLFTKIGTFFILALLLAFGVNKSVFAETLSAQKSGGNQTMVLESKLQDKSGNQTGNAVIFGFDNDPSQVSQSLSFGLEDGGDLAIDDTKKLIVPASKVFYFEIRLVNHSGKSTHAEVRNVFTIRSGAVGSPFDYVEVTKATFNGNPVQLDEIIENGRFKDKIAVLCPPGESSLRIYMKKRQPPR